MFSDKDLLSQSTKVFTIQNAPAKNMVSEKHANLIEQTEESFRWSRSRQDYLFQLRMKEYDYYAQLVK